MSILAIIGALVVLALLVVGGETITGWFKKGKRKSK